MFVSRIEGGLGNQLFQLAFGMQLSAIHGTELLLDFTSFANKPLHGLQLDRFAIEATELTERVSQIIPTRYQSHKPSNRLRSFLTIGQLRLVRERPFGFHQSYMKTPDGCYLVGYWQSERFFMGVREEVKRQFRPRAPLSYQSECLREKMLNCSSIAVHLRRGDYLNQSADSAILNLERDYYLHSVGDRLAERSGAKVFVFSNEINWCRRNLDFGCPTHFVEHNNAMAGYEDLWLMTAADCVVMANSTFSWWGAYLNERPNAKIYSPSHWFKLNTLNDQDLACEGWTLVEEGGRTKFPLAA
ncbi:MAG TPA: alpha-1,2-fucosyltransferase [Pirellula sp.]|nr:alpha-1,2-fucosyltransferase [Pirellula sp.]